MPDDYSLKSLEQSRHEAKASKSSECLHRKLLADLMLGALHNFDCYTCFDKPVTTVAAVTAGFRCLKQWERQMMSVTDFRVQPMVPLGIYELADEQATLQGADGKSS